MSVSLESPEPCVTYSYGVSAIVGGQESERTALQEVPVPPRVSSREQPVMVIQERNNRTVTFVINNPDNNYHCKVSVALPVPIDQFSSPQVGQYHVKYNNLEEKIDPSTLDDGKITLEVE